MVLLLLSLGLESAAMRASSKHRMPFGTTEPEQHWRKGATSRQWSAGSNWLLM